MLSEYVTIIQANAERLIVPKADMIQISFTPHEWKCEDDCIINALNSLPCTIKFNGDIQEIVGDIILGIPFQYRRWAVIVSDEDINTGYFMIKVLKHKTKYRAIFGDLNMVILVKFDNGMMDCAIGEFSAFATVCKGAMEA